MISKCCGAPPVRDLYFDLEDGFCSDCKEHTAFEEEDEGLSETDKTGVNLNVERWAS